LLVIFGEGTAVTKIIHDEKLPKKTLKCASIKTQVSGQNAGIQAGIASHPTTKTDPA
jgi:hypothetical protein